jgi:N-acetylglucosaminyl-diphospho-decaprenol L-rhamnosyltransferase
LSGAATSWEGLRAVVLTYGTGGQHRPLLDSLLAEGLDPDRIQLVHNPSAPGEEAPRAPEGVEAIAASYNLGYAAAMNLGIERQLEAGCELLLLLTHDARLRPGALGSLVEAARADPGLGVVGPVLVLTGTETAYSFGGINRANGSVGHRPSEPPGSGAVALCDWVDGGTMLIRAEALREVGGFDARFWGYTEEADLCLRIGRAGFRVGVVLAARADQDPGGPKRPGPWAYLLTRNGLAYAKRSVGVRGVLYIAARALGVIAYELFRALVRATPLRPGSPAEPWAVAVGMARGMLDFARGRWGPPPASLPGGGDIANLEPPPVP